MKITTSHKMSLKIIDLIKNEKNDCFKIRSKSSAGNVEFGQKKGKGEDSKVVSKINGKDGGIDCVIPPNVRIYGFKKVIKVSKSIIDQAKLINFDSIIEYINKDELMIDPFIVLLENDKEGFISYSRNSDDITYLRWKNLDQFVDSDDRSELITNCFSFTTKSFFIDEPIDNHFAIKLLIYLRYGEINEKFIPSKEKRKISNLTTFVNNSTLNITYANSLWKTNIRCGEFAVRGHFRMQPIGAGRSERKLIWIEEFTKNGYNLKAGKTRSFPDNFK